VTFPTVNAGLPTVPHRPGASSASGQPETSAHKRLRKAAQEFESILISQLLGKFDMGFSPLAGDSPTAGSETLNSLAVQTLSGAMASRGGFGIGKMLVHQLEPRLK
jgi:Rod binding domain-containing protein